jgi:hypothetical protein
MEGHVLRLAESLKRVLLEHEDHFRVWAEIVTLGAMFAQPSYRHDIA